MPGLFQHVSRPASASAAALREALTIGFEPDPGFRAVTQRLTRKGMVAVGVLGIALTLSFITASAFVAGKELAWTYADPRAVVLWDKMLIMALSGACIGLARTQAGVRWGRLATGVLMVVVGAAMVLDDVVRGDISFSASFLALVMVAAVGTIPYRPTQMLVLCLSLIGAYFVCTAYLPPALGVTLTHSNTPRVTFISMVAVVSTIISALLYHSRHEQYRARRREEALREELGRHTERLLEMERAKDRFFANISHEFRTPLTLVMGPVEDALDGAYGPVAPGLRGQLRGVRRNARRVLRLINELLDLSKLEAGQMQLHDRPYDLAAFVQRVVQTFSPLADRRQVALQFDAVAEGPVVAFDADKLEKVLVNLLSNAFKFTPAHGKVRVAVRRSENGGAEVGVRDTGTGISADVLPHIFDRFAGGTGSAVERQASTGIGLALARELVALHGGTIEAESAEGFGSTFTVRLPAERVTDADEADAAVALPPQAPDGPLEDTAAEAPTAEDAPTEQAPPEQAPTVLVADDNAELRAYLRSHLQARYHVAEAADGAEALALARTLHPDLIISDVMMPERDGYAVCRAVRADEALRHTPVILLTARAGEQSTLEGLETGADDYVNKPFSAAELLARVDNLLSVRRELRERYSDRVFVGASDVDVPSAEAAFVERVRGVVEEHLGDTHFGVERLAQEVGLSPRQLRRRLKAALQRTPSEYIKSLRLQRAAQLLAREAGQVSEIAYAVGFQDADHFSRLFKEAYGSPPSVYQKDGTERT